MLLLPKRRRSFIVLCSFVIASRNISGSSCLPLNLSDASSSTPSSTPVAVTPAGRSATRDLDEDLKEVYEILTEKLSPLIFLVGTLPNVGRECKSGLLKTAAAVQNNELWAVKLVTASGIIPNGMMEWGLANLGSQDQCLRVWTPPGITGQYCTLFWRPSTDYLIRLDQQRGNTNHPRRDIRLWLNNTRNRFHVGLRSGICAPSTCTEEDLNHLAVSLASRYGATASVKFCQLPQPHQRLSRLELGIVILLGTAAFAVVFSTGFEITMRAFGTGQKQRSLPLWRRILRCYSALSNTEKLLDTSTKTEDSERLRFLHGMKFFSMLWVVLGHVYYCIQPDAITSVYRAIDITESFHFQVVANGFLAVSTFFFISGFLLSYTMLKSSDTTKTKNPGLQVLILVLRRYLRMTIPAMVVVLVLFLTPLFVKGPLAQEHFAKHYNGCLKNWWTVLLHINNFNKYEEICLDHYWYISADLQIFVVAAVTCVLMTRKLKAGLASLVLLTLACAVGVAVQTYGHRFQPLILFWNPDIDTTTATGENLYSQPFSHAGSFALGMMCAACVIKCSRVKIQKWLQALLWPLAAGTTTLIVFCTWRWNNLELPSREVAALYAALHKDAWALALFWIAFACSTGRGGIVRRFLAWRAYVIPSRLTYSVYLIHYVVYLTRTGVLTEPLQLHEFLQVKDFLGVAVLSYLFAFVLYLTVEAPIVNLEKLFMGGTAIERNGKTKTFVLAHEATDNVLLDDTVQRSKL